MLKNYKLLLAFVLLSCTQLSADTWTKTYGGSSDDWGNSVKQTTDGGFIIAGLINYGDVYLIKTNSLGDTLWTRTYGGPGAGYSLERTTNGGFIIAGYTASHGAGGYDVYLIREDSVGDTLWTRTYGGSKDDKGFSVAQTTNDGFIITGWTNSYGAGNYDVYLIKTDSVGDALWTKTYGGINYDGGRSVLQATDGGFILVGGTESYGTGNFDIYLIKTDSSGDTVWTRTFGGSEDDRGYSVLQTSDGGFIVAGITFSYGAGVRDVYVIRVNFAGDTLWTKTYGGTNDDICYSINHTKDGGFIITGWTSSYGAGGYDVYLIKIDSVGDTLWTRTYGGSSDDWGNSVEQTTDDGFVIAGLTSSFGAGSYDVYLIKTDSLGNVGVEEKWSEVTSRLGGIKLEASPNLFTNQTVLMYQIPATSKVSLALYDITGSCMKTLVNELKPAGTYSLNLNSKGLKTGVYFLTLSTDASKTTQKITLLK
ncbi:MAG: T9SS type A sorting domain-containing protein [bacterium]|nr:T9SS type A sorting domain-containing protein [bacterium]